MRRRGFDALNALECGVVSSWIIDTYMSSYGDPSLSDHRGVASLSENPWLKKFAEYVGTKQMTAAVWVGLELKPKMGKDDLCELIDLLYIYTASKGTLVDAEHESHRVLKSALDLIIPAYDDLIEKLSALIKSSAAAYALTHERFNRELRYLTTHRKHAEEVRKDAAVCGSNKINWRDWYLNLMVLDMERVTGRQQISGLVDLIDAACAAHNERTGLLSEETLKKRIQRTRQRLELLKLSKLKPYSTPFKDSFKRVTYKCSIPPDNSQLEYVMHLEDDLQLDDDLHIAALMYLKKRDAQALLELKDNDAQAAIESNNTPTEIDDSDIPS